MDGGACASQLPSEGLTKEVACSRLRKFVTGAHDGVIAANGLRFLCFASAHKDIAEA